MNTVTISSAENHDVISPFHEARGKRPPKEARSTRNDHSTHNYSLPS